MVWTALRNSTVVTLPLGLPDQNVTSLVNVVGFQQAPSLRGTMSIVFSCAIVLIIAVCHSHHPNQHGAPLTINTRPQRWLIVVSSVVRTILAPEATVSYSVQEYITAREYSLFFQQLGLSRWTEVHSHILKMQGFSLSLPNGRVEPILSVKEFAFGVRVGAIRDSDLPTAAELREMSPTDSLATILVIFQILWLVIQCLARWWSRLPVSCLEFMSSGYVICAVLSYVFCMRKPCRVDNRPFVITCTGAFGTELPSPGTGHKSKLSPIAFILTSCILSTIHFAGWNGIFPTDLEQQMWRIASIFHASMVGICSLSWIFRHWLPTRLYYAMFYPPIISRILLISLSITSLRALPAGAYIQPTWTSFMPHFG
ncbi:hypothetical protein DL96DRAFT_201281 [Flagelloscypha sp. PMI_526]|nr:hypothetical protein DL96DRAFT_201281 [Flagelloscypha sp. PMI_526]